MEDSSNSYFARQANEVDLLELLQSLWVNKLIVVAFAVVATALATIYAFISKPVYEAQVYLLPPSLSDIAPLSLARNEMQLKPFKVEDVYSVFTRNLQSEDSLRRFFKTVYLPSLNEASVQGRSHADLFRAFNRTFRVISPDRTRPDRFAVAAEGREPLQIAGWVKSYIDQVASQSLQQAIKDANQEVDVAANNYTRRISSLRASAKARREDRIIQLREALQVAEAVGLSKPPIIGGQTQEQMMAIMDGSLTYMRGANAIRAELKALESRASDDPFIPELRELEQKRNLYASLRADPSNVRVFQQDGEVVVPDEPIKPKKGLIIIGGAFTGVVLGAVVALLAFVHRRRKAFA
ncbi:Wzz/FepE/Etk N-terminal domain-containing protein [Pseudomonas sp. JS3066]|uniref:LPS O-antigen chain length determinant protein WzzB n=1 Tax=Pseudomonas sp. JS3066 TaxID=3090665 RepID=UPI002E7B3C5F|nr:Wzz/FepE/Etk N-terminal domain-containing protein [Pseudomonas sp. JS3066]WVK94995.1 Wzz/FepE/Etk N-terminal domain-containing protein [Pseudomonas sp. JS3066]